MGQNLTATATKNGEAARREARIKPPVDIYETSEVLTLLADLPGVKKESLSIEIAEGVLTLQAESDYSPPGKPLYQEFEAVSFFRQFPLPDNLDTAQISAELKHGVLTLRMPKAEAAKPKKIEVQFG